MVHELRSGKFDVAASEPKAVLELLTDTKARYAKVAKRAAECKSYEELFGKTVS